MHDKLVHFNAMLTERFGPWAEANRGKVVTILYDAWKLHGSIFNKFQNVKDAWVDFKYAYPFTPNDFMWCVYISFVLLLVP